ncbi:hypothetical protein F4781DRAFT_127302 [Annulohypoxylon bovei var. microspora]|nr:hypothetical protein F4781DRAFT_127302 [Annulohypoxylon bovei var. microspora]
MPGNMSAPESTKSGKRKGTRSVSSLTPAQLARKRANDREAQRAIRARTKEHIESLEREIDDLRNHQNRDQTIQNLLRKNEALEEEVRQLRGSMGLRNADVTDPYQAVFHNSSPPRPSAFPHAATSYPILQNMAAYHNIPDATEPWSSGVAYSIASTASSPASSGATDDFGSSYISTSAPTTSLERSSLPSNSHSPTAASFERSDSGFESMKPEFGCSQISAMPINPTYHFQPWNTYPMQYQPSTPLDHVHQISQIGRCQF